MTATKGIIFSGDSFTWGEGLELFSYLPSTNHYIDKQKYSMDGPHNFAWDPKFKYSHRMFQQKSRFARLVANHFNTWEDVYDRNGGCPYSNLDELFFQIDRTPLTDVSDIVIQITDIWRSVGVALHPMTHYFGIEDAPADLSKKLVPFKPRFGNNSGLYIFDLDIDDINNNPSHFCSPDVFEKYHHQLEPIIRTAMSYEGYLKKGLTLDDAIKHVSTYVTKTPASKIDLEKCYNFIITEYSDFGSNVNEIFENLSLHLVKEYLWFIETYVKEIADEFGVNITFIPPFNESYEWFLTVNNPFYMENRVLLRYEDEVHESWAGLRDRFDIQNIPGFEWSRNMHPNVDGHMIFANSIIHHWTLTQNNSNSLKKII